MSDDPANTAAQNDAPAAPGNAAPAPQTITLTVEEFEAKLNERAAAVRRAEQARAKQAEPPKPTAQKTDTAPTTAPAPTVDVAKLVARETAFALATQALSADQRGLLRIAFDHESPEDVAGWLPSKLKAFGSHSTATTNTNQPQAAAPSASAAATQPSPAPAAAPAGSSTPSSPIADRFRMSKDVMQAHLRSMNFNVHNRFSADSRKAIRAVAEEGRRLMEAIRVVPPEE
jgi:hypothetical protein